MRAICTSASLQASTWVSPGFTLFRHISPPFGSKQAHSISTHGGPDGVGHFSVHTTDAFASPFQYERSTGNNIFSLARLFDSLVRVSRRVKAPHFGLPTLSNTERTGLAARLCSLPYLRSFHHDPGSALVAAPVFEAEADNAVGLVLASEMEVLPLSLSRLQVLCHSLSKVLFKLSLTLLVRYRSSYSVFNFGRHIPAA